METQQIGYVPSNYVVIDDGKLQSQEYAFTVQKCFELATSRTAPRAFVRISKFRGVRIAASLFILLWVYSFCGWLLSWPHCSLLLRRIRARRVPSLLIMNCSARFVTHVSCLLTARHRTALEAHSAYFKLFAFTITLFNRLCTVL